ncbi:hypothetical protein [Halomonas sp. AOP35-4E-18]|uniref:hypothetical protein n=1 Tax=Halomonas sp. AOP35-4E-18 TaxID=3457686 RepID=UPI004034638C
MFSDELHLLQINPWADHWLERPVYRGDIATHGILVPTLHELTILPAPQAAEEAKSWLYGKPEAHIRNALRASMMAHPAANAPELQKIIRQIGPY